VGDSVSLWLDRSSEGNDLAQTSIVSQPMLVEVDGVNWLRFDGVDDFMEATDRPILRNVSAATFVVVFSGIVSGGLISVTTALGNARFQLFLTSSRLNINGRRLDSGFNVSLAATATLASNTKYIAIVTVNYINGTANAWQNGQQVMQSTAWHSGGKTSDTNATKSFIGQTVTGSRFSGIINESIITPRAITTTERQRIERSLAAKYGITLA
jgi:hypothetical protein